MKIPSYKEAFNFSRDYCRAWADENIERKAARRAFLALAAIVRIYAPHVVFFSVLATI